MAYTPPLPAPPRAMARWHGMHAVRGGVRAAMARPSAGSNCRAHADPVTCYRCGTSLNRRAATRRRRRQSATTATDGCGFAAPRLRLRTILVRKVMRGERGSLWIAAQFRLLRVHESTRRRPAAAKPAWPQRRARPSFLRRAQARSARGAHRGECRKYGLNRRKSAFFRNIPIRPECPRSDEAAGAMRESEFSDRIARRFPARAKPR
jgi:hypothetical protein